MIDAHQHFWKYDPAAHGWITDDMMVIRRDFQPEDLEPLLRGHGIEGSVVVQVDQTEEETLSLLALANRHAFIRGVVGWIDLRNENLRSRLDYFASLKKLKGFRHIVQAEQPGFLDQPAFRRGVKTLAEYRFTYDLLIYHHQLKEAVEFVRHTGDTQIVVDHIAKPSVATGDLRSWEVHMRGLARFPNVWCKVSGMVTEAEWRRWKYEDFVPYLDVVVDAFGTERLLYGSDWPVCLVAASYDEQFAIIEKYFEKFSAAEKNGVFGENAKRFYNL